MVLAFGGPGSGIYRLLFVAHILAVVVAFSPLAAHSLQLAQSRGSGARREIVGYMARNTRRVYAPALVAIGLFGILLVVVSDGVWAFSQGWVSGAFGVWVLMNGVVHGLLAPGERAVAAGEEGAVRRVDLGGLLITVLLLVMMYLMVWKPGL